MAAFEQGAAFLVYNQNHEAMSCNCNCNGNRIEIKKTVTAGDTFSITYKHKQEGVIADLPEAYDLVIALHKEGGEHIATYRYQDGDIKSTQTGIYVWTIGYETSKSLSGNVIIEMTIHSADMSFVQHCNERIVVTVIPTDMNEIIEQ